jgi:hypothetical protein
MAFGLFIISGKNALALRNVLVVSENFQSVIIKISTDFLLKREEKSCDRKFSVCHNIIKSC